MAISLRCHPVVLGIAKGKAVVTNQSISFWGGIDPKTGIIIDRRNDRYGKSISGKIFFFPYSKGSSTSSAVFLEAVRCGKAPKAIINLQTEPLVAVGSILAKKLYNKTIPIVDHVEKDPMKFIKNNDRLEVNANAGIIRVFQ